MSRKASANACKNAWLESVGPAELRRGRERCPRPSKEGSPESFMIDMMTPLRRQGNTQTVWQVLRPTGVLPRPRRSIEGVYDVFQGARNVAPRGHLCAPNAECGGMGERHASRLFCSTFRSAKPRTPVFVARHFERAIPDSNHQGETEDNRTSSSSAASAFASPSLASPPSKRRERLMSEASFQAPRDVRMSAATFPGSSGVSSRK